MPAERDVPESTSTVPDDFAHWTLTPGAHALMYGDCCEKEARSP